MCEVTAVAWMGEAAATSAMSIPSGGTPPNAVEAGDRGTDGAGAVLGDGPVVEDEDAARPAAPSRGEHQELTVDRPGSILGGGDGLLADLSA